MAATLKPWNIHVSLIEPGPVSTDLDYLSPYGTNLAPTEDPYYPIFENSGLLEPGSPLTQSAVEIALIVKNVIEAEHPYLRYQTAEYIQDQAALRLVDPTGDTDVAEWNSVLFP